MDPNGLFVDDGMNSSGDLPDGDDEDLTGPDYYEEIVSDTEDSDDDDDDEGSGSGDFDEMDDLESTVDTPTHEPGNELPEENNFDSSDNLETLEENEVIPKKKLIPDDAEQSNEISMASTANDFFKKTEVIVALVAGAVVGLLFAVFIITLLVVRYRRNKGDVNYDTVKKPIYKKAPTVEA